MLQRALPLMPAGVPIGALVLVRDITEVRRRDRALITKDATIREIHHRVKNNLQTVAALLRLQARRVARAGGPGGAGGVGTPGRLDRAGARDAVDVRRRGGRVRRHRRPGRHRRGRGGRARGRRCALRREGTFGVLPAEIATPLVMVLNELLLNAVEHGFAAARAAATRRGGASRRTGSGGSCTSRVADNGRGLPDGLRPRDAATGWACRSSGRWPPASCAAPSRCATGAGGGTEAVLVVPLARNADDGRSPAASPALSPVGTGSTPPGSAGRAGRRCSAAGAASTWPDA